MSTRTYRAVAVSLFLAASAVSSAAVSTSFAAEMAFSQSAFDAAKKSGEPILVHITAPWCSTCAAQKPILEKLRAEAKFKGLAIFNIDFDSQKKLMREFGARSQSTLIVFKDGKEVGRSSGDTSRGGIAALLGKAV